MNRFAIPTPFPVPETLIARMEEDVAEWLKARGGDVRSIFRKIEALFESDGRYQAALGYVSGRQGMERHRDRIDYLFCELFPEYLEQCTAYLDDRSRPLRDIISSEQARACEHAMFCTMVLAVAIHDFEPPGSPCPIAWNSLLRHSREFAAQTATLHPSAPSH